MELRHLRYFVAVAEELSFRRAAARVRVAQPALSQQVRQLEEELGVRLLDRNRRRVLLTEPGRVFLVEARRTLADAAVAVSAARRAAEGGLGSLRLGYVDLATWQLLPAILRRYRERFPRVEVLLTELHREPQRQALLRGELDAGFFTLGQRDHGLTGDVLLRDPLVAALPAGHRHEAPGQLPLALLAGEPWVLFPRELKTHLVELILQSCAQAGFVPRVVQEASQLNTLVGLVSGGVGVTLVPRSIASALRSGVTFRPLAGEAPALPMHLVWREGDLPPAAARLVEVAREEVAREQRRAAS